MPKKNYNKKKRFYKKKKYFKKKETFNLKNILKNQKYAISKQMPVPIMFRTILSTALTGYVASGQPGNGRFTIKLNSCFQPFNTGENFPNADYPSTLSATTYHPKSWNQWVGFANTANFSLYRYARIVSSAIKCVPQTSDPDDGVLVTVIPFRQTAYGDTNIAAASPFSKERIINQYTVDPIKSYCVVRNLLGITKNKMYSDNDLRCDKSNDPSELCYWLISYKKPGGNTFDSAFKFFIEIKYYVVFEQDTGAELSVTNNITTT